MLYYTHRCVEYPIIRPRPRSRDARRMMYDITSLRMYHILDFHLPIHSYSALALDRRDTLESKNDRKDDRQSKLRRTGSIKEVS